MHESSFRRMADAVNTHLGDRRSDSLRILDVGSFDVNGSYRDLFTESQWEYVGLDIASGPGVDVAVSQLYRWREIRRQSFDVIISGQAFEHIEFPWVSVLEVARILRPGGMFILIVPSAGPEHRYPLDCWRFYPDGLVALAHWGDLHVVSATTHWEDEGWTDGDMWHDSVLVARRAAARSTLLNVAKQWILRRVMSLQAQRRQVATCDSASLGTPGVGAVQID